MKVKHFCLALLLAVTSSMLINKAVAAYKEYSYSDGYDAGYEQNYDNQQDSYNSSNNSYSIPSAPTLNLSSKNVSVNPPIPLSYKSKAEVFALRMAAVEKSIFKNPSYKPSEEVFGGIEDGKPWISINSCVQMNDGKSDISGASEESRFILNPTALVMINYPFSNWCSAGEYKEHENISAVSYDASKNEIIVTYYMLNFPTLTNNALYEFNGVNARDLGYKYAYVDKSKSTFDLQFTNDENIGNSVAEFQNFLHTGGSCKHESGCNNGSPYQPMLHFENPHKENAPYKNNKEIYIKLWKNRPNSTYDAPDIVERIIIEKS